MQELQARIERLQCENDQLQSQVEKSLELGKVVQDGDRAKHPVVRNKGKKPIIFDNEAPEDDELSSWRPPFTSPPLGRNARGNTWLNCEGSIRTTLLLVTSPVALPAGLGSRLTGCRTNHFKPLGTC